MSPILTAHDREDRIYELQSTSAGLVWLCGRWEQSPTYQTQDEAKKYAKLSAWTIEKKAKRSH